MSDNEVPFVGWGTVAGECGHRWGFGFSGCLSGSGFPDFVPHPYDNGSLVDPAIKLSGLEPTAVKMAVIGNDNDASRAGNGQFANLFKARGAQVVYNENTVPAATTVDYTPFIQATDTPGCYLPAPRVISDVAVDIAGPVARTRLTQRFENPADGWVEGIYVFPLPETAAVDTLKMKIGYRFIEGQIKERHEARQITDDTTAQSDHGGVPAEAFGKHFVRDSSPGLAGLVGLASGDGQHLGRALRHGSGDLGSVTRTDVGIRDHGVPVSGRDLLDYRAHFTEQSGRDPDGRPDVDRLYQVTSPAPVRTLATRARVNRRSESRLR